ncbi:MAG: hypothetical protein RQM92_12445 [Candidatus Syntrophopropionicum ammoniitolerans]
MFQLSLAPIGKRESLMQKGWAGLRGPGAIPARLFMGEGYPGGHGMDLSFALGNKYRVIVPILDGHSDAIDKDLCHNMVSTCKKAISGL